MLNKNLGQIKHYHRNSKPALATVVCLFFFLRITTYIFITSAFFEPRTIELTKDYFLTAYYKTPFKESLKVGLGMGVWAENAFPDGPATVGFQENPGDSKVSFQAM